MKKIPLQLIFKYTLKSISARLLAIVLVMIVPIVGISIYTNIQSRDILLFQVENTHRNMLQSYAYQLDTKLSNTNSELIGLAVNETDPQMIAFSQDGYSAQYATVRLKKLLEKKLISNSFISGYFMQIPQTDGYEAFLYTTNTQYTTPSKDALQTILSETLNDHSLLNHWLLRTINKDEYLFLCCGSPDKIYAGAYIKISFLLQSFAPSHATDSHLYLLSTSSLHEFSDQLTRQTMLVEYPLSNADFLFAETFSRSEVLSSFPFLQKYTPVISAFLIIMVLLLILLIHRIVTIPLLTLTNAMHQIKSGDLDYRIPQTRTTVEIELVNNTFNHMADEIQQLKIDVYEQQLKMQKAQLRNLQLQIKPHFLINTLNMVYNLIETDHLDTAKKLIHYSVDFFRYMVKVDDDLVPLNEELSHVKAYLDIQSLRYAKQFDYSIQVDPMIYDVLIPPVMIQTFVENSIKYALTFSDVLHIDITISSFEKDFFPYAQIVICDNGAGYPDEYLSLINDGKKILKKDGSHIGIRNTIQKLQLLFDEKASWHFSNQNGATTEIIIPATFSIQDDSESLEDL